MNPDSLHAIELIAKRARREPPPPIDVSDRVMNTLRMMESAPERCEPFLAAFSTAAAAAALLTAFILRPDLDFESVPYLSLFQTAASIIP